MRFTINKPRWKNWSGLSGDIKFKKIICGSLSYDTPHTVMVQYKKTETLTDDNPNCPWLWRTVKKKFDTLEEARDFLNSNIEYFKDKLYLE